MSAFIITIKYSTKIEQKKEHKTDNRNNADGYKWRDGSQYKHITFQFSFLLPDREKTIAFGYISLLKTIFRNVFFCKILLKGEVVANIETKSKEADDGDYLIGGELGYHWR